MASERCENCQYTGYPASFGPVRQKVAIAAATITLASSLFGSSLYWIRRKEPFLSLRDGWNTAVLVGCTLLLMEIPYRGKTCARRFYTHIRAMEC